MGRKGIRRELAGAHADGEPVLVRRNLWKADHLEGYVVAVGRDWAVLHLVHDVDLNGWSAVRLDTIRDVERQGPDAFINRALRWADEEPAPVELDTTSVTHLLRTASNRFPVVTVHTEAVDPLVCAIGRPQRIGGRRMRFLDISSNAEWATSTRRITLADVTRVDVGARYEQVLHHLGGYPPVA
ncbi:MAG TPA: hypothetical protein VHK88_18830 [Aquihabitans sp.]|jgi:hypothetical protein|nr:hypothetical protein [Aquihabitans sp.]